MQTNFSRTIRHCKVHYNRNLQITFAIKMAVPTKQYQHIMTRKYIEYCKKADLTSPTRQAFSWKPMLSLIIWLIIWSTEHMTCRQASEYHILLMLQNKYDIRDCFVCAVHLALFKATQASRWQILRKTELSTYTVFGDFKEFHKWEETILWHVNMFLFRTMSEEHHKLVTSWQNYIFRCFRFQQPNKFAKFHGL